MNIRIKSIFTFVVLLVASLFFTQCAKDDDIVLKDGNGALRLEITDGPIDDASIKGAFVTVTEIKVDGKSYEGFQGKQTIDLMAYQKGAVALLGTGELEAGTYANITLVLDYSKDAAGNAPGCYVLTEDNKKHDLSLNGSSVNEVTFDAGSIEIEKENQTDLVLDFDLRKAIKEDMSGGESKYAFVTSTELNAAVRAIKKGSTGIVKGSASSSTNFADQVVVYAYKKGTYDANVEMKGQGTSMVEFANAVTSAKVDASGNFELHFLEEGDYELHFAAYDDTNSDGSFELKGSLMLNILAGLDLNAISVGANATVTLDISVTGVLPL